MAGQARTRWNERVNRFVDGRPEKKEVFYQADEIFLDSKAYLRKGGSDDDVNNGKRAWKGRPQNGFFMDLLGRKFSEIATYVLDVRVFMCVCCVECEHIDSLVYTLCAASSTSLPCAAVADKITNISSVRACGLSAYIICIYRAVSLAVSIIAVSMSAELTCLCG